MYTLGIGFSHHSSVCLLKENEVVFFSSEERLNRKKEWGGGLLVPYNCLSLIKTFTNNIDYVCGVSGGYTTFQSAISFLKENGVRVHKANINNAAHHLYHAAAGFYSSNFDYASCIVVDGAGSMFRFNSEFKASESTSHYEIDIYKGFRCTRKQFTVGIYENEGIPTLVSNYPDSKRTSATITEEEIIKFKQKLKNIDEVVVTTELDTGLKYHCGSARVGQMLKWKSLRGCDGKVMGLSAYGSEGSEFPEKKLAYQTQKELEYDFLEKVKFCESENIVLSGGCALNILGNSLIKRTYPHLNVYADPIAHDATIALGAAAYNYYKFSNNKEKLIFSPYTGFDYNISVDDVYERTRKYSLL